MPDALPVIPLLDQIPDLTWREKLCYLAWKFHQLPQKETPVIEMYKDGHYTREIHIPEGTLFIGRAHKYGHECQLLSGKVVHITENGRNLVEAPFSMRTTPGYQVVLYALTDVVGVTRHPGWMTEADIAESAESVLKEGAAANEKLELKTGQEITVNYRTRLQ